MVERLHEPVRELLTGHGLPRGEALLLLGAATGRSREQLLAESGGPLPAAGVLAFRSLAARRRGGEPIAYLVGHREFYGRRFRVDPAVLIPRPETELLVDTAIAFVDRHPGDAPCRILDLGTGSGAIAITLKLERPGIAIVATDASAAALAVARDNAVAFGAAVRWLAGDWYGALTSDDPTFDLIVSNPPYVASGDRHLLEGDLRFEPRSALTDEDDGLAALRIIAAGAGVHLRAGGMIAVEHGDAQAAAVRGLMQANDLENARSHRDLAGIERVTVASAGRLRGAPHARL